jgi:hypothetical protein
MSDFDFESQFRGAIRTRYAHTPLAITSAWLLHDLPADRAAAVLASAQRFLGSALADTSWEVVQATDLHALRDRLMSEDVNLVVTYRNLRDPERYPHTSLGTWVDTLTQATPVPVLVLPDRADDDVGAASLMARLDGTHVVLVATDHLTDDPELVRWAVELTRPGGRLLLSHVEDEDVFERYMGIVERVPELDNDIARNTLHDRLLKEPTDFCTDVAAALAEHDLRVEHVVQMGSTVATYRSLLETHPVELIVADAKDPERRAMSALAHAIAVEFTELPILLL